MADNDSTLWAQEEYHFHGQRADEHVMLVRNQHPIVLLSLLLVSLATLLIPYLVIRFFDGPFVTYTVIIYSLVLAFSIAYHLYGYRNSLNILSDQRILNVEQRGFFKRQISEAELSRIQDVSSTVEGVLRTLCGVGNVTIRTASKDSLLVLKNIYDPYEVQQSIVRALNRRKSEDKL